LSFGEGIQISRMQIIHFKELKTFSGNLFFLHCCFSQLLRKKDHGFGLMQRQHQLKAHSSGFQTIFLLMLNISIGKYAKGKKNFIAEIKK
jgi:hypothetical protein